MTRGDVYDFLDFIYPKAGYKECGFSYGDNTISYTDGDFIFTNKIIYLGNNKYSISVDFKKADKEV